MAFFLNEVAKRMLYCLERYDRYGFLKAPLLVWFIWLFLAKAWVVFVVAGVSRDHGSTILTLFYPDHSLFYLGLSMGMPSLVLMWLINLRTPDRSWINGIVSSGRSLTLFMVGLQFIQTLYHVYLEQGSFDWVNAITLIVLLWCFLYLFNSRIVRDCFRSPFTESN